MDDAVVAARRAFETFSQTSKQERMALLQRITEEYAKRVPDIAEAIAWAAQLPAHMNVNDMVLMPARQAGAYYTYRKTK